MPEGGGEGDKVPAHAVRRTVATEQEAVTG